MKKIKQKVINVTEAKAQLSALLELVANGKKLIIGKAGKPIAFLVKYENEKEERIPGVLKDKINIADDFDDLPESVISSFECDL